MQNPDFLLRDQGFCVWKMILATQNTLKNTRFTDIRKDSKRERKNLLKIDKIFKRFIN